MEVLLINYDLNFEIRRPPIVERIRKLYPDNKRISESSYAIYTNDSPETVYDKFKDLIDSNDNCMVFTLRRPYAGWHRTPVIEWLESRVN